ncbi:MOSC domain-containing protein [Chelatococcus reniformis]
MRVVTISRYPIKGLSAERLTAVDLEPGRVIAGDRRYAIENGPSGFDPAAPGYHPKVKFLMLMRNERLAALDTRFDDATTTLAIRDRASDRVLVSADLSAAAGRAAVEAFFADHMADELRGPPKVLEAARAPAPFSFSDVAAKVVSIINLASVAEISALVGTSVDPRRFRGNLTVDGLPAWAELDMVGATLETATGARLKVVKRIVRCAATNVDPQTAQRDLDIPRALMRAYGHMDCGVYAEVVTAGRLAEGNILRPSA